MQHRERLHGTDAAPPTIVRKPIHAGFEAVTRQLGEYLEGDRRVFELPLNAHGDAGQIRVWNLVAQVAYGQTVTYGDLARQLGDGTSAQAVGAAVGRNPCTS
jgi:methylated-DNA-[protein]-cysteine S-methyltransferase